MNPEDRKAEIRRRRRNSAGRVREELTEEELRALQARRRRRRYREKRKRALQLRAMQAASVVLVLGVLLGIGIHRKNMAKTPAEATQAEAEAMTEKEADADPGTDQSIVTNTQETSPQPEKNIKEYEPAPYVWASPKGAENGLAYDNTNIPPGDPSLREDEGKIIYLTFDDGPCKETQELLNFLDQYPEVKVTFFVVGTYGEEYPLLKREAESGHSIGVHSYTHKYDEIYASREAYWEDFEKMQDIIEAQTGYRTQLMRFPGGSSNTVSSSAKGSQEEAENADEATADGKNPEKKKKKPQPSLMRELCWDATIKGYCYFDWNSLSGDAAGAKDPKKCVENIKENLSDTTPTVVLNHDTKDYTVEAMKVFIPWALDHGYTFLPLSPHSYPAHHLTINA